MKRTLLLIWTLLLVSQVFSQPKEVPCGPFEGDLFVYMNDSLIVTSTRMWGDEQPPRIVAQQMFGTPTPEVTTDGIYFDLRRTYYKLYLSESRTVFTIQQRPGTQKSLGPHLVWFITYIRAYRANNSRCSNSTY